MKELEIVVDYEIFISDITASIITTFYIRHNNYCFPNEKWTDLTDSVLGMWLYSLIKLQYEEDVRFKLFFMDGPFRLDVAKDKNMQLTINCINARGMQEISEYMILCNYYDYIIALYDAIKAFNHILYFEGLNTGKYKPIFNQTVIAMKELKQILCNKNHKV